MDATFVKADRSGEQNRVYLTIGGVVQRGPVHVVHDLPHLVVESVFDIDDGLWAELEAGRHAAAARAVAARDPKRQNAGQIVSGAAEGVPASQWLTAGHRRAKVLTNAVANRFGDGPDSPAGVRERVARSGERSAEETLSGVEDETIAEAITGVAVVLRRWESLPQARCSGCPGRRRGGCWEMTHRLGCGLSAVRTPPLGAGPKESNRGRRDRKRGRLWGHGSAP